MMMAASGMTRQTFLMRIVAALALAAAVGLAIFFGLGRDKAVMFAPGAAVLAALPLLSRAMRVRARAIGERPFWRFVTLTPLLLWALILIGFWALFLSSRDGAIMAHLGRNAGLVAGGAAMTALYWFPPALAGLHLLSLLLGREKAAMLAKGGKA
jgi:hypothetical protein